jgi:CRP/FNR family cyclic AMP-dependent transcriptional regulator
MIGERDRPIRNEPHDSRDPLPTAGAEPDAADVVCLVSNDPHTALESGQVLFTEGDPPTCMYVVKNGTLRIRSGSVIYEDVGPGGIVGEMGLVETNQARSATVYALTDCELVAIDKARFFSLVGQAPNFAIIVMQVLSRRLRAMDRRYRAEPWA